MERVSYGRLMNASLQGTAMKELMKEKTYTCRLKPMCDVWDVWQIQKTVNENGDF